MARLLSMVMNLFAKWVLILDLGDICLLSIAGLDLGILSMKVASCMTKN